ncbi:MAG: error-prone DNA polymerase [Reyranella sp.]|uniref:error-prone DNA polymerase n=1 Tax=Reyranella sp. TaxID=1929291 RepID=UPI001AC41B77|nr:error-prone DNA polymerase [Reyranella sp.]MBN9090297.1 error-prone DNA polymerase [Reyranella sp.]
MAFARDVMPYAELQVTTNYSFLRSGSHPGELVFQAASFGHYAIGIADRNTLAGVVRAYSAVKEYYEDTAIPEESWIKLLVGARLETLDGYSLLAYPMNVEGYKRLSLLLSKGNEKAAKGECKLTFEMLAQYADHILAIVLPPRNIEDPDFHDKLRRLAGLYRGRCYLAATMLFRGDDATRVAYLDNLATQMKVKLVATNDVHYHVPERRALHDVVAAIRLKCTVEELGFRRFASAERHLKPAAEMERLFRKHLHAIERIREIVDRCQFSLNQLRYQYPVLYEGGETPMQKLERLTWKGAARRFPTEIPEKVVTNLRKEFDLIASKEIAPYFLTVHEIVEKSREMGILCQGRGSAANSSVCYCLGITEVDTNRSEVLFERFLSNEREEPPDIDVDFEHERREKIIQWIYETKGRTRAALAATVIAYRSRSAIRDVGKALGLSPDTLGVMADTVWGSGSSGVERKHVVEAGLDVHDPRLALALELSATLCGFPRHLSQHVGGFVLTEGPLIELVPIQNAAMEDRTVVEWDKDDLDALKIYKVDVLALGMLTALRKSFDLIKRHYGEEHDLGMPPEDPEVYGMLCKADSVGVFQVESRAQMSMLPRLKPKDYYDLVVEVAIVRPGPIQGGMVHPYLKNRDLPEDKIEYSSDKLKAILKRTRGVPLFQEQAMQIAIDCAGFSPARADKLRRAMATFRRAGTIHKLKNDFINGMVKNEYEEEFAERCFKQIEGFGEYGFPESHAASFAILVYVSSWVKYYYPEVFAAALLNSQPMGFYAPAQLVRDAREHEVEVRPPDVNASDWDCTLEPPTLTSPTRGGLGRGRCALRLGFRQVNGLKEDDIKRMVERRTTPYRDPADLWRRGGLSKRQILALARADAFASMGLTRRDVLWAVRAFSEASLPLLEARPQLRDLEPSVSLPKLTLGEQVIDDYSTISMSLRAHPLQLLRPTLSDRRMADSKKLREAQTGDFLQMAGLVLVRQRPGTASGVVFVTLEDEFGIANLVVWPRVFDAHRRIVMGSRLLGVAGKVQRDVQADGEPGLVIHLVAERLWDWSADLDRIADLDGHFELRTGRGDEVNTDPGDRRVPVPEANATRHRAGKGRPVVKQPYDRSRIHLDRPVIKIASHDFH